ncbi:MAG: riboflavin synthase [Bacteroidota bacterium]|nr:riboflavin synthase [Bacteroidota bacterium]
MFTGIIEATGIMKEIIKNGSNRTFWIQSILSSSFKRDQSISHNGVCLTVEETKQNMHRVTAIKETITKTNLKKWQPETVINLERSLLPSSRLDGHFVQGHIDTTGVCEKIKDRKGSWEFSFSFSKKFSPLIIEKGSICINGISLTAFDVKKNSFKIAVIPYTYQHTNLQFLKQKDDVNLEFDMIGKYMVRKAALKNQN